MWFVEVQGRGWTIYYNILGRGGLRVHGRGWTIYFNIPERGGLRVQGRGWTIYLNIPGRGGLRVQGRGWTIYFNIPERGGLRVQGSCWKDLRRVRRFRVRAGIFVEESHGEVAGFGGLVLRLDCLLMEGGEGRRARTDMGRHMTATPIPSCPCLSHCPSQAHWPPG